MKRIVYSLVILAVLSVSSCTKNDENAGITTPETPHLEDRIIDAKIILDDVWTENTKEPKSGDNNLLFVCYLFDPSGACIRARGENMTGDMTVQFQDATTAGEHKIYGVTNLYSDEIPMPSAGTVDMSTEFPLSPNRDISLGYKTFTVVDGTMDYAVQVEADHIMAQLALAIQFVPSDVTAIKVELPNQGETFKFDGTISGNSQTQTFDLVKAETANENGSYHWSLPESLVLPSATGTGSMPINVIATIKVNENNTYNNTIETSSSIVCNSGGRYSLRATWNAFYNTATVVVKPWTEDVIEESLTYKL